LQTALFITAPTPSITPTPTPPSPLKNRVFDTPKISLAVFWLDFLAHATCVAEAEYSIQASVHRNAIRERTLLRYILVMLMN
jgi:hypothetical protein